MVSVQITSTEIEYVCVQVIMVWIFFSDQFSLLHQSYKLQVCTIFSRDIQANVRCTEPYMRLGVSISSWYLVAQNQ